MGSIDAASKSFNINIIGAGVAGLAAGLALAKKGHNVTCFESNKELSELGAGIQLSSNATRVLYHWNLQDEFRKVANEPKVMKVMRFSNNAPIGEIAHNPQCIWEYGYPHWQIYRPDLQRVLAVGAQNAGVKIVFGRKVVDADVEKAELTFEDGSKEQADLVVCADGIMSKNRERLPGNAGAKAIPAGEFCFRTVISKEKMNSDPETAELMKGEDSMVWGGPGVTVLGYTVSGGQKYNTLISTSQSYEIPVGSWSEPGDINQARDLVKNFSPAVRKVWEYVDDCVKWTLGEVQRINSYTSTSGRFVLIGDAAHAVVPHAGQGGVQALEDCAALAEFVSSAESVEDLAGTMKAFQESRQPRIENVRLMAYGNQAFLSMPDGPQQQERDKLWTMMTKKWKAELDELGEEGIRAKPRPEPAAGKDMRSPESRQYVYGYDIFAESAAFLKARAKGQR